MHVQGHGPSSKRSLMLVIPFSLLSQAVVAYAFNRMAMILTIHPVTKESWSKKNLIMKRCQYSCSLAMLALHSKEISSGVLPLLSGISGFISAWVCDCIDLYFTDATSSRLHQRPIDPRTMLWVVTMARARANDRLAVFTEMWRRRDRLSADYGFHPVRHSPRGQRIALTTRSNSTTTSRLGYRVLVHDGRAWPRQ